jgi:hypothetical protein
MLSVLVGVTMCKSKRDEIISGPLYFTLGLILRTSSQGVFTKCTQRDTNN